MAERIKVSNWGNSLGVRIPKRITESVNIKSGSEVEIYSESKNEFIIKIVDNIKPKRKIKKYDLNKLLKEYEQDPEASKSVWGSESVGKEIL